MIFGKGECGRTRRTSNENLTKSAKIAAFWQGSFYSCPACHNVKNNGKNETSIVVKIPVYRRFAVRDKKVVCL